MAKPRDYEAVRTVLDGYIAACAEGDVAGLEALFHPAALMAGYLDGDLDLGTPQPFYDELLEATPPKTSGEDYCAEISFIHIAGPIASAAIVEDNLLGKNYVNHFHFLKIDGHWKIVGKIYNSVE